MIRQFWPSGAAVVVIGVALQVAAQQRLDLHAALNAAETGNLELRAARQQRALALAGLTVAGQLPNPLFGFTATRDTPHEGVSFDLPLQLGGKRGKRIAVAQQEQQSTEIDLAVLSRQIRRRTREAFYRSMSARAQTDQAKAALELSKRSRDMAEQRFEAGDVAQLEVLQAEVELARSTADYETTVAALRAADITLAALLNRPFEPGFSLEGKLEDLPQAPTLEALMNQGMQSSADVLRTSQDVKTEEARLALAKAQRIPDLDVSVGADFNSPPDFNAGGKGGIAVTLPLFYRGRGEVALSTARIQLLRLTLAAQRTNVSAQVASAYFDYDAKTRQARQYREHIVPQTVKLEQMAEESYQSGKANLLTLLDAQRRLNDVRRAYVDALFAAQTSFAVLEEAVGTPLD